MAAPLPSLRSGAALEKAPVVIEVGHGRLRAGFAAEDAPRVDVPTPVRCCCGRGATSRAARRARPPYSWGPPPAAPDAALTHSPRHPPALLPLQHIFVRLLHGEPVRAAASANAATAADPGAPLDDATARAAVTRVLSALLVRDLNVRPAEHKVLLLEPSIFPLQLKRALHGALALELRVPAVSFVRQSVAACLGAAAWTGLVVDVGHRDTRIVPVIHGRAFAPAERGASAGEAGDAAEADARASSSLRQTAPASLA
jgi:hypothetical protein